MKKGGNVKYEGIYCMYLRKSREDEELEKYEDFDTLARHEKLLTDFAKKNGIQIGHIYREVVSGDSIAEREEVQKMLKAIEEGVWAGTLLVEVERLARGDTIDQGTVANTFKYAHAKIITPIKTYDPDNEFDEEYFEFGLFMARREYKTINRRLQEVPHPAAHLLCSILQAFRNNMMVCRKDAAPPTAKVSFNFAHILMCTCKATQKSWYKLIFNIYLD